jgi:hypothetical protein
MRQRSEYGEFIRKKREKFAKSRVPPPIKKPAESYDKARRAQWFATFLIILSLSELRLARSRMVHRQTADSRKAKEEH